MGLMPPSPFAVGLMPPSPFASPFDEDNSMFSPSRFSASEIKGTEAFMKYFKSLRPLLFPPFCPTNWTAGLWIHSPDPGKSLWIPGLRYASPGMTDLSS